MTLVIMGSVMDGSNVHIGSGVSSARIFRLIRIARLARAFRIVQIINFVRALRDLIVTTVHTMTSFLWSMILLGIVIYVFSIFFTYAANDARFERAGIVKDTDSLDSLEKNYGSLFLSMYTLFKAISSGADWGDVVKPLWNISAGWGLFFLVYLTFCFFLVLNVITSSFCQSAIESSQRDLDAIIYNELKRRQAYIL